MSQYVTKIKTNDGDKQIDYNALANLPELNTMFSNPNLLINSDFRNPVNQRGNTSYTYTGADSAYTIDRWCMNFNSIVTVNDGYTTLTGNTSNNNYWYQPFEHALSGTFTLSVCVKNVTGDNGVMYVYTLDDSGTKNRFALAQGTKTITFEATNLRRVGFCALKTGVSADIYWIKLEQGSIATTFVPRLYAEELALCQRYYEKRTVIFFPYGGANPTTYYLAVNGDCHRVTKYRQPTLTASTLTDHNNTAVNVNFVSATQTKDNIRLMTVSAACDKYLLRSDIEFDAEIY